MNGVWSLEIIGLHRNAGMVRLYNPVLDSAKLKVKPWCDESCADRSINQTLKIKCTAIIGRFSTPDTLG